MVSEVTIMPFNNAKSNSVRLYGRSKFKQNRSFQGVT